MSQTKANVERELTLARLHVEQVGPKIAELVQAKGNAVDLEHPPRLVGCVDAEDGASVATFEIRFANGDVENIETRARLVDLAGTARARASAIQK